MSFTRPFLRSDGIGVAVGVGETVGAGDAVGVAAGEGTGEADGVGEIPCAIADVARNKTAPRKNKRALRAHLFPNFSEGFIFNQEPVSVTQT
jgi:hypothetical protein